MSTPNERTMIKAAVVCLTLVAVGACSDLDLGGGQEVFQVGNTYYFGFLGGEGDVRIIEGPDERGWALVEVVDGFSDIAEGEVLLNTSTAIVAWRIDSEPVE